MPLRTWLPPILWALLIFMGSSIPGNQIPGQVGMASRVLHVLEFMVFGFLLAHSLKVQAPHVPRGQLFLIAWILGVLYGMTDEIHQAFVMGRNADRLDVIADAMGSLVGVAGWLVWKKRRSLV